MPKSCLLTSRIAREQNARFLISMTDSRVKDRRPAQRPSNPLVVCASGAHRGEVQKAGVRQNANRRRIASAAAGDGEAEKETKMARRPRTEATRRCNA